MLHTIGGSSDSLVVMTSFVVSHFCCSNPTSLLPHYLPIKKKKKFVTYIKKLHTIGTNLFVLTCFISTLVRIVGLDPARGHSKLDYLSYCLLNAVLWHLRGYEDCWRRTWAWRHMIWMCIRDLSSNVCWRYLFKFWNSSSAYNLCYSWRRTFHNQHVFPLNLYYVLM